MAMEMTGESVVYLKLEGVHIKTCSIDKSRRKPYIREETPDDG